MSYDVGFRFYHPNGLASVQELENLPYAPDWILHRVSLTDDRAYPYAIVGHHLGDESDVFLWRVPSVINWRYVLDYADVSSEVQARIAQDALAAWTQ